MNKRGSGVRGRSSTYVISYVHDVQMLGGCGMVNALQGPIMSMLLLNLCCFWSGIWWFVETEFGVTTCSEVSLNYISKIIRFWPEDAWIEQRLADDENLKYISPFHVLQASTHHATHIDGTLLWNEKCGVLNSFAIRTYRCLWGSSNIGNLL